MEILWLGQIEPQLLGTIGRKAGNLSLLADRHRVPPGFCLPMQVHSEALAHSNGHVTLPKSWHSRVASAYAQLAEQTGQAEPAVAVRSSGVDEDSAVASFAGQHDTFLNVRGVDGVIEAIHGCWASAHSPRALAYRQQQGLAQDNARIAVLVQQLVRADVSAVVFSMNPVSGARDQVVINASWGLGESIVGGTVNPDTFWVDKTSHAVLQRVIANKQRMTVSVPGGSREVGVPQLLRTKSSLRDEQTAEMSQLAVRLEQEMSAPVDVECAFQDTELYLLQCRPITTLT